MRVREANPNPNEVLTFHSLHELDSQLRILLQALEEEVAGVY
jgi:hypothetical protein